MITILFSKLKAVNNSYAKPSHQVRWNNKYFPTNLDYSNSSRSKISNKHTSNKKSIQVVQQKIDNHLQKTYERLRLDAEK